MTRQQSTRLSTRLPSTVLQLGAAMALAAAATSVHAQDTPASGEQASQWGLGLAASFDRKPYRGVGTDTTALPLVMFENRWVSVFGPGIDLKLPSAGPVSFRLRARYSGDGYEADDSSALTGMDKRKGGFWLGGAAIWRTGVADLSAELLGDASGNSKGNRFKLAVERRFASGAFDFTPRLAAIRLDEKYVDYYYGVKASEVQVNRSFYAGDATVNVEAGLRIGYALAPKQNIFLDVSATRLGSGIKDSPIVEKSNQSAVRIGYLYRF
ncbi:MAG: MipA/OmpV family protein [Rhodoferax sp.]|nr:MipA/OmpV family protein [Rhodoferax sp.]